jgi:hypothetical protein
MNSIPLPTKCLTLLPPWPQAIALEHEDAKRLENRGYGVAKQLEAFRGLIGLSQSKAFNADYTEEHAKGQAHIVEYEFRLKKRSLGNPETWKLTAGKLWLVAELIRIVSPEEMAAVPEEGHGLSDAKRWHVPGQFGLILGSVWRVEPMPCTGGIGAWTARWCAACGHLQADSQGDRCRSCKEHGVLRDEGEWPQLKVVKECL